MYYYAFFIVWWVKNFVFYPPPIKILVSVPVCVCVGEGGACACDVLIGLASFHAYLKHNLKYHSEHVTFLTQVVAFW